MWRGDREASTLFFYIGCGKRGYGVNAKKKRRRSRVPANALTVWRQHGRTSRGHHRAYVVTAPEGRGLRPPVNPGPSLRLFVGRRVSGKVIRVVRVCKVFKDIMGGAIEG